MAMLRSLVYEGERALQSPVVQDLFALFNYPPFQRLQQQTSEEFMFYMQVYRWVEQEYSRFTPMERLGIVQNIIETPEIRVGFIKKFQSHSLRIHEK